MAFDNNQNEPALPGGNEDYKRKSTNFLPKYFRTPFNEKFFGATLDQLIQPGSVEKINAFYGRKISKAFSENDFYVKEQTKQREDYQLEPVALIKDYLGNVDFFADYNDYINEINAKGGNTSNHDKLNQQEYYSWDPHIDWDKFINFREYYWLPNGPEKVTVIGQSKEIVSTYTVTLKDNIDNISYIFTPDGITSNPNITLYRGQTYRFVVNTPSYPISFTTKNTFIPGSFVASEVDQISSQDTSLIYDTGIIKYDQDGNEVTLEFIENGVIEFTVPETAPDQLFYTSKDNPNLSGMFRIYNIEENTFINVEEEILGKQTYTTSAGWDLSNGMKLEFAGNVFPEKYSEGEWFVEGVGDKIVLVNQEDLVLSGLFTDDITVPFDETGFDFYPFGEALGFPTEKDYIVINRSSEDGNLWSRYNRWFHKDVIEKSLEINQQPISIDQTARASRPIIEFEKNLKLYNFGSRSKKSVNLIDTNTKDVFSTIEGSLGYNVDGIELSQGMRILFVADTDRLVKNNIYKVNFVNINNELRISLIEESDTFPTTNETVLVTNGNVNKGKFFYYNGIDWKLSQDKTKVNQPPLFDLFDENDVHLADEEIYKNSQFVGNKIFSFKEGLGTVDTELGFPLEYKNIINSGDITFEFNLINESVSYIIDQTVYIYHTEKAFLRKYNNLTEYEVVNGWKKGNQLSNQNVLLQYIGDGNNNTFAINVYDEEDFLNNLWLRVYKNDKRQVKDIDFELYQDVNYRVFLKFTKIPFKGDIVVIKTRSNYDKNENGLYEVPINFDKNPRNENLESFTFGEVLDHVFTITEESNSFVGDFPGKSNLRDLGNITNLGKKFVSHSSPINLSLYHLLDDNANVIDAIHYSKTEYSKFKRKFLDLANTLGFEGPVISHVNKILEEMVRDKVNHMPFYFSDMVPFNGILISSTEIIDTDQLYFPLNDVFNINVSSTKAVTVYKNGIQSLHIKDYTFNDEGFVVYTGHKEIGDLIEIYYYENTNGSYVPSTPTKLGLYPSFLPEIYIEKNVKDIVIENNVPYKLYGIPTLNNQVLEDKLGWAFPLYLDIQDAKTSDIEKGGNGEVLIYRFKGLTRPFFMPVSDQNIGAQDVSEYEEWIEGNLIIQGHDGSRIVGFKDFRDNLVLDLEKRIFNNIKVSYDKNYFNIHNFTDGLYRKQTITKESQDQTIIGDFLSWVNLINRDYSYNSYYTDNNSFTYNYSTSRFENNELLPGWWRQVYKYAFDTDRPHTHPWEMLGFSIKPDWWDDEYGAGPYTSNNLILWEDLEKGIIRHPFKIDNNYVRPGLTSNIPVDQHGDLLSPLNSGLVKRWNQGSVKNNFTFGDGSPTESAWRNSSDYPFSLIKSLILNNPSKAFSTGFDRTRQVKNIANQIIYKDTSKFINLENIQYPTTIIDDEEIFVSGFLNYIVEYQRDINIDKLSNYKDRIRNLNNQISFKIGGFTDKDKFKLILDSRTPLNEGNVFVPEENYDIKLVKSKPIKMLTYSGVVIEKQAEGYYVSGYDQKIGKFYWYKPISKQTDYTVVVGGVTESYVKWESNKAYVQSSIVEFSGGYYRVIKTHSGDINFDSTKFAKLNELPIIGGRRALIRKNFETTLSTLQYGSLLNTSQDVVDFLLGYEQYLISIGFVFEQFNKEQYDVYNFIHSAKQFLFWLTQNWAGGSVLVVSPLANTVKLNLGFGTVDNIRNIRQDYTVLKSDGTPISQKNLRYVKDSQNNFSISVIDDAEGIYFVKFPIITIEHAVIIDNTTVFNDVIYDVQPGYRQERIKAIGYRTSNWNGSFDIPGFFYDEAIVKEWEQWKDYSIGDTVKYKEFYYIAKNTITGSNKFRFEDWVKIEKPEPTLYPNFDYRAEQFKDFYDLDSDNFDISQQKLAQHLIGYQKRKYLENIINDDISQYKFYQGFILEKGTKNSLTKLFDVLSSADKDSFDFYEEWAIKSNQYGASDVFDEVEFQLDESKFILNPQPIILTNIVDKKSTDLIYRIKDYEVYHKSSNYTHKPFLTKNVTSSKSYIRHAGFVHPDDVRYIFGQYNDLLTLNITEINYNDNVWIGNVDADWNVYRYEKSKYTIDEILTFDDTISLGLAFDQTIIDLKVGDIIGVYEIQKTLYTPDDSSNIQNVEFQESSLKGFFKIETVVLNKITFIAEDNIVAAAKAEEFIKATGFVTIFKPIRYKNIISANDNAKHKIQINDKLWIDDSGNNDWSVLKLENNFKFNTEIANEVQQNTIFGSAVAVNDANTIMVVGAPNDIDGKVYIYQRANTNSSWTLNQTLSPRTDFVDAGQKFGFSVDLTGDGTSLIISSPYASNVKTKYKGEFNIGQQYFTNDIVNYQNSFWKANTETTSVAVNFNFDSFNLYDQTIIDLGLDQVNTTDAAVLLTGNYPLTNISTNHILVRVKYDIFYGLKENDKITFKWNTYSNVNQTQIDLVERQPFDGSIDTLTNETLTKTYTVSKKVEIILHISAGSVLPSEGTIVRSDTAAGVITYVYQYSNSYVLYINNVSGNFSNSVNNNLYVQDSQVFVGTYTIAAPIETNIDQDYFGGFLFFETDTYEIGSITEDSGRGLVIQDIVVDGSEETNYYYNILDYRTTDIDSENTDHSLLGTLSFQGFPGPFGIEDPILTDRYVVRAPKLLTDTITPGDSLSMYFNKLENKVSTFILKNITYNTTPVITVGEKLLQEGTGAYAYVYDAQIELDPSSVPSEKVYVIKVEGIYGQFDFTNKIIGSINGDLDLRPISQPYTVPLLDPADIGLSFSEVTDNQNNLVVDDLWDGYIVYRNTEFLFGQPFDPIPRLQYVEGVGIVDSGLSGQIIRDVQTGATAEVIYYKKTGTVSTVYVKNVTGSWSKGADFDDLQELQMLTYANGPLLDAYNRPNIYTVDRTIGQIQKVSLGYDNGDIGKLLVFRTEDDIPIVLDNTSVPRNTIKDIEYSFYITENRIGQSIEPSYPSITNLDWTKVYYLSPDEFGDSNGLSNFGIVYIYGKYEQDYILDRSIISPDFKENHYFGYNVKITSKNQLTRAFILASESESVSNAGKIYFLKNGIENNITYNWEYAKNKKFKGKFSNLESYVEGDIVYITEGAGVLYQAITNMDPGLFDAAKWSLLDNLIDYVGYIPNDTGIIIRDDSADNSSLLQTDLYDFASDFDISDDGEVIIVTVKYLDKPNVVAIYRNINGFYAWDQNLTVPSLTSNFGHSISISPDGTNIAIGAPIDDEVKNDQGLVFVYKQQNQQFELIQTLESPQNEIAEMFGWKVDLDSKKLVVSSRNGDRNNETTFDESNTTFDNKFTSFVYDFIDDGAIYIYEKINDLWLYAHNLNYEAQYSPVYYFGRNFILSNNHIYIGLQRISIKDGYTGAVIDFKNTNNNLYITHRQSKDTVDLEKIKRVLLYNTKTKTLIKYLDYVDPLQGKIPGPAEQNIFYKLYYDPATYTTGTASVVTDKTNSWNHTQVGRLWWDLNNAKFYYPYLEDVQFSANFWSEIFLSNSIDIYEWVESDYLPSEWDLLADTNEGMALSISGLSKYGDECYVQYRVYDKISQNFTNKYYFWVKNKKTIPAIENRTLSAYSVSNLIANPSEQGYEYLGLISNNSFVLYNCKDLLKDKEVAVSIQWYTNDNQNNNVHNEYQIITEGLETSLPNRDIEMKWVDSLTGYDLYGRRVPDDNVSEKYRYGNLNNPRQGWFINRAEALKQYIDHVNIVLKNNLIIDTKNLSNLLDQDTPPSSVSRLYDDKLETYGQLTSYGTANIIQAEAVCEIVDGKIVDIIVTNPGKGYLVPPTYTVSSNGTGLELDITINDEGSIASIEILNNGQNYNINTTITIRKFAVLIESDEYLLGKWSVVERNTVSNSWDRIRTQGYNVSLYWEYIDWYNKDYNKFTIPQNIVDYSYQLDFLDNQIGDIVKINNVGTGGWLLLKKIDNQVDVDYTVNYETIGRNNGTIQFKEILYNPDVALGNYDRITFDTSFYDNIPSEEIRIIFDNIKNNILVDDLKIEYNKLFFASLRYVLSEQQYVDWAFKTSFIKIKHNVGELRRDVTFNNDNLSSYESYVKEVKPYKAKIREYISNYDKTEINSSYVSDFDLSPKFQIEYGKILPYNPKIINDGIIPVNGLTTYPNRSWLDSLGSSILEIKISDSGQGYINNPVITFESNSGNGAKAVCELGPNGSVANIKLIDKGFGYLVAPKIIITGEVSEGGNPVRASVILEKPLARSLLTKIRFDRLSGKFLINSLAERETFIGSGSKYVFDLKWPMSFVKKTFSVTVAGQELLKSEYSYKNVLDKSKNYDRYYGRIEINNPPSANTEIIVNYNKDISILHAQDRVNLAYDPNKEQFGKNIALLMDGIDYGGVEVKSFEFGDPSGWDSNPWSTGSYDTYDVTYQDKVFELDGSTIKLELTEPFENNVIYNVYKNGIRIDDINYVDENSIVDNPNAIMPSIIGDGILTVFEIDEYNIPTQADDIIIIRKSTSDGSFIPSDTYIDTSISGGNLDYNNAKGLNAEDINVDGDGFFTQFTSKGPEEIVPGHVADTLDIKIYEKPTTGTSNITSRNYIADGLNLQYDIGGYYINENSIFVKVDNQIKELNVDYTIDNINQRIVFENTVLQNGSIINILSLDYSGINILDIDTIISDGLSNKYYTHIRYEKTLQAIVTVNGKNIDFLLKKAPQSSKFSGNAFIELAQSVTVGDTLRYAIFEGEIQNYSTVTIDTFVGDGSTQVFELSQTPFNDPPNELNTIVKVNNKILNPGYTESFNVTSIREYKLRLWQVPVGSLRPDQLLVFLNNQEIIYQVDWSFSSASEYDPLIDASKQLGSTIYLKDGVGKDGDKLKVYIVALEDSTASGGEYRYGYFENEEFIKTPGLLHLDNTHSSNDTITVYQFSNHDSQRIDRQSFDITERTTLSQGIEQGVSIQILDGSTAKISFDFELETSKFYEIYLNDIRLDDPYYGTSYATNINAQFKTIQGNGTYELNLSNLGIATNPNDIIKVKEVNSKTTTDDGTLDWYELRRLRAGFITLNYPAVADQYVWVSKNGILLSPSVDYYLLPNKMEIKLLKGLLENDVVETIHFSNTVVKYTYGWRQFKDVLNRYHYLSLDGQKNIKLAAPLNWYDRTIQVDDGEKLPKPNENSKNPGIIFVEGERIEYFIREGNLLKQLRRGTLGTGVKEMYDTGTEIYDQSIYKTIPYKDEILTTVFTADGSTNSYELDFTPNSVNEFEVFLAGNRLRKTEISSYQLDTVLREKYGTDEQGIFQDSPEGDIILPPEFTLQDGNKLVLETVPVQNQKIIVVRKIGKMWKEVGESLSNSNNSISNFIRSVQADLPR